jgi:hypothetical protein
MGMQIRPRGGGVVVLGWQHDCAGSFGVVPEGDNDGEVEFFTTVLQTPYLAA